MPANFRAANFLQFGRAEHFVDQGSLIATPRSVKHLASIHVVFVVLATATKKEKFMYLENMVPYQPYGIFPANMYFWL